MTQLMHEGKLGYEQRLSRRTDKARNEKRFAMRSSWRAEMLAMTKGLQVDAETRREIEEFFYQKGPGLSDPFREAAGVPQHSVQSLELRPATMTLGDFLPAARR